MSYLDKLFSYQYGLYLYQWVLLLLLINFFVQMLSPQIITRALRPLLRGIGFSENFTWDQRKQDFFSSILILSMGLSVLTFGTYGYYAQSLPESETVRGTADAKGAAIEEWEHALYQAIQLISFNTGVDNDTHVLRFARDCAILLAFLVASEVLRKLFSSSFHTLWLACPLIPRTVICGLGRCGRQLMEDLGETRQLVIVESDRDNPHLERARELGAIIVPGHPRSQKLLFWIGAHRAREVFIVTDEDQTNVEAVLDLAELVKNKSGRFFLKTPPRVYVQINDTGLSQILRESDLLPESGMSVQVFNAREAAAEKLVTELLIDFLPQPNQVAHFVLCGFGAMGQTLALALAEFFHCENQKRSRMTILYGPDEASAVDRFRNRYPHFSPEIDESVCDGWNFPDAADDWDSQNLRPVEKFDDGNIIEYIVNASFLSQPLNFSDDSLLKNLEMLQRDTHVCPIVIVCGEEDNQNASAANDLRLKLQQRDLTIPIFSWIPVQPRLADLVVSLQQETAPIRLIPFGEIQECCDYDSIVHRLRDELAEAINYSYQESQIKDKSDPVEPLPLSSIKEYDLLWSNMSAATHVPLKLAVLGLEVMSEEQAKRDGRRIVADQEIQNLIEGKQYEQIIAAMEHARWVSERLLRNWKYEAIPPTIDLNSDESAEEEKWNAHKKNMTKRKVRHSLVPFESLDERDIVKDNNQVSFTLNYCSGKSNNKFSTQTLCLVHRD